MGGAVTLGLPPQWALDLVLLCPLPAVPDLNWPCLQLLSS